MALPPATLMFAVAFAHIVVLVTIGVGVGTTVIVFVTAQVFVAGFVPVVVAIQVYTPLADAVIFGKLVLPIAALKPFGVNLFAGAFAF